MTKKTSYEEEYQQAVRALEIEKFIVEQICKFSMTDDFEAAINEMLKDLGLFMKAERVYIFEIGDKQLSNTYEWCAEGVTPQIENLQALDYYSVRHWLAELREGNCLVIDDIESIADSMTEEYEILKMQEIRCCIEVPMILSKKLIGFIGVDNAPNEMNQMIHRTLTSVGCFLAVSIKNFERRHVLEVMSYTDKMTGCANRNAYISRMEKLRRMHAGSSLGVAVCDLNGLKTINDTYGHSAGDKAICGLANGLMSVFSGESVFRLGGDEFIVLCSDISEMEFNEKMREVKLRAAEEWCVSVSVGCAWTDGSRSPQELIELSDTNMYNEKRKHYERAEA